MAGGASPEQRLMLGVCAHYMPNHAIFAERIPWAGPL